MIIRVLEGFNLLAIATPSEVDDGVIYQVKIEMFKPSKCNIDLEQVKEDPDLRSLAIECTVKFDGCAHLYIPYIHFCGRQEAESLGALMGKIYDIAQELMPGRDLDP